MSLSLTERNSNPLCLTQECVRVCLCVYILNQSHNGVKWMLITMECRLSGPRDCIGHILPTLPLASSCQMAPHRQHQTFLCLRSKDPQRWLSTFSWLLVFLSFFFCLLFLFSVVLPSMLASLVYLWVFQTASSSWSASCFPWPCFLETAV